jgi:signal transduction histidine kinase
MSTDFARVLARGGDSGALIARRDWSQHTLGPIDGWPAPLRNALSICLAAKTPILVCWGAQPADLIKFYNDAYSPVLPSSWQPRAMGALASEVWADTWQVIRETFQGVLSSGEACDKRDNLMLLERNGIQEESYFDHAHSPLYGDNGHIVGVFSTVSETTARVLSERRLRTLRALAEHAAHTRSAEEACRTGAQLLYENAADAPFCMLYGVRGQTFELIASAGIHADEAATAQASLPLARALAADGPLIAKSRIRAQLSQQAEREGRVQPHELCLLPIRAHPAERVSALLVIGLSPNLRFDDTYRDFVQLAAYQLGSALANVAARELVARSSGLDGQRGQHSKLPADLLPRAASEILRQAPVAIALLRGPDFVFELVNERCEQMLGSGALTGKRVAEVLTPLPAAQRNALMHALSYVRESGQSYRQNELPVSLQHSDGRAYFVLSCQPLHAQAVPAEWLVVVAVDVTEQVELRRKLETMSREREGLLAQEQDARAAAEAANRVKDEFLAVLGHELRNPLAPITTALALMRQKAPLDHEAVIIERQVGHLRRLVEDLLDVSRITRGKVELKKKPLDLAQVVREAIELASPLLEERQQHLGFDVPDGSLRVLGDRTRLAQVLANLLTNASKYSDRGTHISVHGRARPERGVVELSVSDHGIGIEPDMLPNVWNAFTQGAQAIDRSHGGLGLGLTIVRSLVALHGGSVSAHSAGKGLGSEFRVLLPLLADDGAELQEPRLRPSQTQDGVFGGYKILLVDDNEDAVELLAEWFRMRGASVETALDGLAALDIAKRFEPDVALLDLGLPAMSGYDVARRLRAQEKHRKLLLVAVTGYGEQSARELTSAAGFDDHCVKPLDLTRFEQRLLKRLEGG